MATDQRIRNNEIMFVQNVSGYVIPFFTHTCIFQIIICKRRRKGHWVTLELLIPHESLLLFEFFSIWYQNSCVYLYETGDFMC